MRTLIAATLLFATATQAQQSDPADQAKRYMNAFIGRTISDFAFEHGPPSAQFPVNGGRMVFQWEEHRTRQGVAAGVHIGNMTIYKPPPMYSIGCRVSITAIVKSSRPDPTLADWTIESWRADGNGCA